MERKMRREKRWLKQVLKAVAGKHYEMPWEQDTRPVAFAKLHLHADSGKTA
jgi:hypothetical protein